MKKQSKKQSELSVNRNILNRNFQIKKSIKSETPKQLEKWMNTYHDMFIVAHNTLMEMSKLYKLKKIKDKKIKNMINGYLVQI